MKPLYESLLDIDDLDKSVTQSVTTDWLKKYATKLPKITVLKNGTLKVWGDLILRNIDARTFPALDISYVHGNVYIEHSALESMQGIFADMCKVIGSMYITSCPNLKNLVGMPWSIENELSVTDCKSFDSLEGAQALVSDVTIIKCKKRFKESNLKSVFRAAVNIYCSEEDRGAMVTEALTDPVLIKMWDQIRNNKLGLKLQSTLSLNKQLDKITASMRRTYKPDDKNLIKEARRVLGNYTNSTNGFMLIETWDEGFSFLWVGGNNMERVNLIPGKYYRRIDTYNGLNECLDVFQRDIKGAKCIYVYDLNSFGRTDINTWDIQDKRRDAQNGAVAMMSESQLRQMLRDQQNRYKAAVAKIKAERKSEAYQAVVKQMESIMERFTKFMNKYIKDNAWASSISYKAGMIFDAIRKGYERGATYQEYGVIYAFQNWSSKVVKVMAGDGSSWEIRSMEDSKQELEKAIARADKRLSEVGM